MKKRVFIVHGWEATSQSDWFPWLRNELEKRGYEVMVPDMPDTERPNKDTWVPLLASLVGEPNEHTYLVGHSMGGNTVLRYLESLKEGYLGGAVIVAPYYGKVILESGAAKKIASPWLDVPIDLAKVKERSANLTFIFSDDDQWVPIENKEFFEKAISAKFVVEHGKGHFNEDAGVTELPSVLKAILNFS